MSLIALDVITVAEHEEEDESMVIVKERDGDRYVQLFVIRELADFLQAEMTVPWERPFGHAAALMALQEAGVSIARILVESTDDTGATRSMVTFRQGDREWTTHAYLFDALGFAIAGKLPVHLSEADIERAAVDAKELAEMGIAVDAATSAQSVEDIARNPDARLTKH